MMLETIWNDQGEEDEEVRGEKTGKRAAEGGRGHHARGHHARGARLRVGFTRSGRSGTWGACGGVMDGDWPRLGRNSMLDRLR